MLTSIVRTSLSHAGLVVAAAVLLAGYGIVTVTRANYDVFPNFVPTQASIQTEAPGFVAEQVELLVTRPLEAALSGAVGVTAIRSESIQGLSVVSLNFVEGTDPFRSRQIVAEKIAEAARQLPVGVGVPVLTPLTSATMDLLKVGFTSDEVSALALRDFVQWTVRPRLLSVPGVARATVFGGAERRIEVRADPDALRARGLTLTDVTGAVRAATTVSGGGFIDTPVQRVLVEAHSPMRNGGDLGTAPVGSGSQRVPLTDVATVRDVASPQFGDALIMGRPGVLIALSSQYGANTLVVTHAVEAALAELKPLMADQRIDMYPALHRPANFIETALAGIRGDLLIGTLLIALVLFVFMRDARTVLVSFVTIPLSLLTAVVVLDAFGSTINTMTLGGLAVGLGVVIDDAVIGIENIVRRLRSASADDVRGTILDASLEVRAPVLHATFVVALTLLPVLLLTGLQGAFFSPLALSFIVATLASLLVAITVTPALALLLLRHARLRAEPRFLTWLKARHERLLARACTKPCLALAVTIVSALVVPLAFISFGAELLPAFRERHYVLQANTAPGTSLDEMRRIGASVSRDLLAIPGIATVEQQIGRAELGEDTWPPNRSEFHVELAKVSGRQERRIEAAIHEALDQYPGVQTEVLTFLGDRIGESLSGETAKVAVGVYGPDLDALDDVALRIAAAFEKLPDATDVQVKAPRGAPLLEVRIDSERLQRRGVAATDVLDTLSAAFQGTGVAQLADGERIVDVAVELGVQTPSDPESAGSLLLRGSGGSTMTLDQVADLSVEDGRATIVHDGGRRRQTVTVNPTTANVARFVARAKDVIASEVALPAGVYLEWAGEAEAQAVATRQLLTNTAVAMLGIVGLLVVAFGGTRPALLILAGAPPALVGGVLAVAAGGGVLSLGALVGFVTLFGIAARTAILLVAHVDHLVEIEGVPWGLPAVLRGTRERVTPILLTALVTILALVPLALETGETGREVQGPMAIVILSGLLTSTLIGVIVTPALILRFRRSRPRVASTAQAV